MVRESPTDNRKDAEMPLPLILEIPQGSDPPQQFPVRIRSLSARGVILTSDQVAGDLDLEGYKERDSIIYLPTGEIREIRGSLLWTRSQNEIEPGVVFGIELNSSHWKVRRALEEQLSAYPPDIKNLWDHWDAVHDEYEGLGPGKPVNQKDPPAAPLAPRSPGETEATQTQQSVKMSDHTIYYVGAGTVLAGLAVYYLAPEFYRLFGAILAIYGSFTIVGKSVWSLVKKVPQSQVQT